MSLTYIQAVDEMSALFKAAWDTTTYEAFYEDVRSQRDLSQDPWASFFVKHASGFQATLGGPAGTRMFRRVGFVTTQVFTPAGNGLQSARVLAKLVADAFEGVTSPGGVRFLNCRINEIGRDGEFYQLNILSDFEYEEIK